MKFPFLALAFVTTCFAPVNTTPAPPVSHYAQADSIALQIEVYDQRLATALEDKAGYGIADQSRVKKDAALLVLLLRALAQHDQQHRLKAHAQAALPEAQQLARSFDDYDRAKAEYSRLHTILIAKAVKPGPYPEPAPLDLHALMRHTGKIHNRLARELKSLENQQDRGKVAAEATALAVIAEAMRVTPAVDRPLSEDRRWAAYCAAMRDGAAGVASGVRASRNEEISESAGRLRQSCSDCHSVFRTKEM